MSPTSTDGGGGGSRATVTSKRRPEFPTGALSYSTYSPIITADDQKRLDERQKLREQFMTAIDFGLQRRPANRTGESPLYTAMSMPSVRAEASTEGEEPKKVYGLRPQKDDGSDEEDEDSDEEDIFGTKPAKPPMRAISITGEILTKKSKGSRSISRSTAGINYGNTRTTAARSEGYMSSSGGRPVTSGGGSGGVGSRTRVGIMTATTQRSAENTAATIGSTRSMSKSVGRLSTAKTSRT